mmetsp:Transcript_8117/g.18545  ORF Transcript_8117/g.18545 Transcript_8117/m.18545 type:complete len:103 (-) Transcript_8117:83-391(-)
MSCFSEAWGELDEALVMDFHFPSFLRNLLACFKSMVFVAASLFTLHWLLQQSSRLGPSSQGADFAIAELFADSGWFNGANQSLSFAVMWLREDIFKSTKLQA